MRRLCLRFEPTMMIPSFRTGRGSRNSLISSSTGRRVVFRLTTTTSPSVNAAKAEASPTEGNAGESMRMCSKSRALSFSRRTAKRCEAIISPGLGGGGPAGSSDNDGWCLFGDAPERVKRLLCAELVRWSSRTASSMSTWPASTVETPYLLGSP